MYHYLEEELDQLRTRLIKMGSLVEEQLELSVKALFEGNLEIAKLVIDRDNKVDKYDNKIDKHCQRIFALTQPVAVDLRLIMSALKMNSELERMGDIAVNIAERVEPLANHIELLRQFKIDEMANLVLKIVGDSIDSFINNDPELAAEIIKLDDTVDNMDKNIFYKMVEEMKKDSEVIPACSHSIMLLKHLERLADHATNIAEDVVFLVNAKIIKHKHTLDEPPTETEDNTQ